MFKRATLCLFVCCLIFGGVSGPAAAANPRPVIIDTDMTTDDFMATLLTLKNPAFLGRGHHRHRDGLGLL